MKRPTFVTTEKSLKFLPRNTSKSSFLLSTILDSLQKLTYRTVKYFYDLEDYFHLLGFSVCKMQLVRSHQKSESYGHSVRVNTIKKFSRFKWVSKKIENLAAKNWKITRNSSNTKIISIFHEILRTTKDIRGLIFFYIFVHNLGIFIPVTISKCLKSINFKMRLKFLSVGNLHCLHSAFRFRICCLTFSTEPIKLTF